MYKKAILSVFCLCINLQAMDSDTFGEYMVLLSNELHVQEKQEQKEQQMESHIDTQSTNKNKYILAISLLVTFGLTLSYIKH